MSVEYRRLSGWVLCLFVFWIVVGCRGIQFGFLRVMKLLVLADVFEFVASFIGAIFRKSVPLFWYIGFGREPN